MKVITFCVSKVQLCWLLITRSFTSFFLEFNECRVADLYATRRGLQELGEPSEKEAVKESKARGTLASLKRRVEEIDRKISSLKKSLGIKPEEAL